ncbi:MAG: DUF3626 domain-containing protein [Candidatus Sericytochromatia bacterium]
MKLSESQIYAIEYIKNYAKTHKKDSLDSIKHILEMSNISFDSFDYSISQLKNHGKVAIHFHPDRLDSNFKSVAENLLEQGIYKSQFETLISNGSVSAYHGGERDLWENELFGGAYNKIEHSQRPKYGAFDLMLHPDGAAPRFGSCYFLLNSNVSQRCTFTYMDSHQKPNEKGTLDEFDYILSALLTEIFTRNYALGKYNLTVPKFINHLSTKLSKPYSDPYKKSTSHNINHYIEAQIHGDINLKNDVNKLVADPSFKGTNIGLFFNKICEKYNIELYWHCGFALSINKVPDNFRGSKMPFLAKRITSKDYIDTTMLGVAASELKNAPEQWNSFGTYEEVIQQIKLLWHILVKYGKPLKEFKNN